MIVCNLSPDLLALERKWKTWHRTWDSRNTFWNITSSPNTMPQQYVLWTINCRCKYWERQVDIDLLFILSFFIEKINSKETLMGIKSQYFNDCSFETKHLCRLHDLDIDQYLFFITGFFFWGTFLFLLLVSLFALKIKNESTARSLL